MSTIAIIIALILAALIAIQIFLAAGFIARLRQPPPTHLPDDACPKVALIICVRGKDPDLADCLTAALDQDYPGYGVHVIVDSRSDPAWPVVQERIAANPKTPSTVQVLADPLTSCSLKCSSLIQAISALEPSYEVIALLDTDVVPHRRWLKDMVAPLADPRVGATTGNRWFAPYPPSWANLCRHAWNAAAVVLMHRLEIAWGGSLAIRRTVIERGRLLSRWSRSYGDDTALNPALRRLGLRLELVTAALITERGNVNVSRFLSWAARQLLSCRLHHDGWTGVLAHGITTSIALGSAAALLLSGLALGYAGVVVPASAALAAYFLALFALLVSLESGVQRAGLGRNGAGARRPHPATSVKLMFAVALTQVLYAYVLLKAAAARSVEWRRARYEILEGRRIRLVEYTPFSERPAPVTAGALCTSLRRGPRGG